MSFGMADHGMMLAAVAAGPVMPTYVSVTNSGSGSSASSPRSVSLPTVAAGDLLIMGSVTGFARPQTTPSGWTRLGSEQSFNNGGATEGRFDLYWRICNGSEGSTVSVAWTGGTSPTSMNVLKITGAHATSPINASAFAVTNSIGPYASVSIPNITTTVDDCLGVVIIGTRPNTSSGSASALTGWDERADNHLASTTISSHAYTKALTGAAGTKTAGPATLSGSAVAYAVVHLAIRGA